MNCGQRRPDWSRVGNPGPREMSDMLAWRLHVMSGVPSLSVNVSRVPTAGRTNAANPSKESRSFSSQMGGGAKLKRPPGIPDDHPLVLQGRME